MFTTLRLRDSRPWLSRPISRLIAWLGLLLLLEGCLCIGIAVKAAGLREAVVTTAALRESLRLTELMVNPPPGDLYEFIELKNISISTTLDLSYLTFTQGITYTFPSGTTLAPGACLLLTRATDLAAFRTYYNVPARVAVLAPYGGKLDNKGETVTLKSPGGLETLISFTYDNSRGWPLSPQGGGHSLVPVPGALAGEPSGSLDYCGNWKASVYLKGSAGRDEPAAPASLMINEFDAHTDPPAPADSNDWIEFTNTGGSPLALDGNWYLSDDVTDLRKFAFAPATIPAGGFLVLDERVLHPADGVGFGLNKAGEQILLSYLPGNGQDRIVDCVRFEGQSRGPTIGRFPDTAPWWYVMPSSQGKPNAAPKSQVVINEVMYHPDDDTTATEYIELFNPTGETVALWSNDGIIRPWRISGVVDYTFPAGLTLAPGEYMVLVSFSPGNVPLLSAFKQKYGLSGAVRFLGPYSGGLSNNVGRISLEKGQSGDPPDPLTLESWIVVDEVFYFDQSPFPLQADGGGSALVRASSSRSGMDPANWLAQSPTPGCGRFCAASGAWVHY